MEYVPMAVNLPEDAFLRAYLEAAEWAGIAEDSEREALHGSDAASWDADSVARAREDCEVFERAHAADLEAAYQAPTATPRCDYDRSYAGHDFYLSRNRHGAGFFDRGEELCWRRLQDAAHAFGATYETFDGKTLETR